MAPRPVGSTFAYSGQAPSTARKSAVLIPLIPHLFTDVLQTASPPFSDRSNESASGASPSGASPSLPFSILFTLRQDSIRHGGQISFPGGRIDPGETSLQAAVRETYEEVGIPGTALTLLGPLTDLYMQHTHTLITPYIGILRSKVTFLPQETEVREILQIPMDALRDPQRLLSQRRDLRSILYEVPYWDIHPTPLWGATAMMLAEFMALVEEYAPLPRSSS